MGRGDVVASLLRCCSAEILGLLSSVLVAQELVGSLLLCGDAPGGGVSFTLALSYIWVQNAA